MSAPITPWSKTVSLYSIDILKNSSESKLKLKIEELGYVVKPFQPGVSYQSHSGKCLDYVCIPREKWEEFEHIIPW